MELGTTLTKIIEKLDQELGDITSEERHAIMTDDCLGTRLTSVRRRPQVMISDFCCWRVERLLIAQYVEQYGQPDNPARALIRDGCRKYVERMNADEIGVTLSEPCRFRPTSLIFRAHLVSQFAGSCLSDMTCDDITEGMGCVYMTMPIADQPSDDDVPTKEGTSIFDWDAFECDDHEATQTEQVLSVPEASTIDPTKDETINFTL